MIHALTFSWAWPWGTDKVPRPSCSGESPLSCLLMDDGGLGLDHAGHWIDKGLGRIDDVISGRLDTADWDGEDWSARFTASEATIYSLCDETHSETLPIALFRQTLEHWRVFLKTAPELGESTPIKIP